MKLLECVETDFDEYGDWLVGETADEFIAGGYTHVRCDGYVYECEVCSVGVSVGEQVAEPTPDRQWPVALELPDGSRQFKILPSNPHTIPMYGGKQLHRTDDVVINGRLVCRIYRCSSNMTDMVREARGI